jgi:hypothetical protein
MKGIKLKRRIWIGMIILRIENTGLKCSGIHIIMEIAPRHPTTGNKEQKIRNEK